MPLTKLKDGGGDGAAEDSGQKCEVPLQVCNQKECLVAAALLRRSSDPAALIRTEVESWLRENHSEQVPKGSRAHVPKAFCLASQVTPRSGETKSQPGLQVSVPGGVTVHHLLDSRECLV